jgi:hypothetical protein
MFRLDVPDLLTVKIGDDDTHANFRLPGPAAFRRLLDDCLPPTGNP